MSSEAIRIESETLRALRERSAQSGEPMVRLAQRYIGEGMRLDRHPGIVFRIMWRGVIFTEDSGFCLLRIVLHCPRRWA